VRRGRQAASRTAPSTARSLIDLGSAVNEVPGGLTPTITERSTLFGYRHGNHPQTGPGALAEQVDAL